MVRRTGRPHRRIEFASYAWLLKGLFFTEAGWLDLHDGNLRFATPEKVVFDVPRAEVTQITYPWHYFGGGLKLHAAGEAHRLSFVLPNGAEYAAARGLSAQGAPASLLLVAAKAADIGAGRGVGREWRRLLGARPPAGNVHPGVPRPPSG